MSFLSFDRWKELLRQRYHTSGSSEIDKVPFHIGDFEVSVNPRQIPAMDGPSRGQWQSLFDFKVDVNAQPFSANEHFVLTYVMVVRFAPVTENDCNYLALATDWKTLAADPGLMAAEPLVPVRIKDLQFAVSTTAAGYLPFGWQWRTRWNRVGRKVDNRSSFPFMQDVATSSAANRRDATKVNDAFPRRLSMTWLSNSCLMKPVICRWTARLPVVPVAVSTLNLTGWSDGHKRLYVWAMA